jgi:hypothetical protein
VFDVIYCKYGFIIERGREQEEEMNGTNLYRFAADLTKTDLTLRIFHGLRPFKIGLLEIGSAVW